MVFLHSSFRVSSTWLWTRFRQSDQVLAYYEIFNEQLAVITEARINSWTPESWSSKHPFGPPYFLEFLPLIKDGGGIASYHDTMAFNRFIPAEGSGGALSSRERIYLASLIAHAERLGKTSVLSSTRSLGRLQAIKSAFPGLHLLVYRNLFQQWCSYVDQAATENFYFLATIRKTIEANQHDPFLRYLRNLFPLDKLCLTSSIYFYCFILLHLYLYAQAAEAADLIVDINRLANDDGYRRATEGRIAEASGIAVDLSDVRNTVTRAFAKSATVEEVLGVVEPLSELVLAAAPSPRGRAFVSKVLADFIEEYQRYDREAGGSAAADARGAQAGAARTWRERLAGIARTKEGKWLPEQDSNLRPID